MVEAPNDAALIVRRSLYARLPYSAFAASGGVDWIYIGNGWVNFQELIDGIVSDLKSAEATL